MPTSKHHNQEWPDDWPEVVSKDFLKEHCEQVVTA